MIERRHTEVLTELLPLRGRRVIDVGCGEGGLCRFLARQGARAIGIESGIAPLARARAARRVADETYLAGAGESLPLAAGSADIVMYLNSFHHVPVERQDQGIAEAARVLVGGGLLCIIEPLAEGSYFALARPVEDETVVRARAHEAIQRASGRGFAAAREMFYAFPLRFEDFAAFKRSFLGVDPRRQVEFEAREKVLQESFHRLADRRTDGYYFIQPIRLNLLQRRGAAD